ncbi:MAG: PAS domain S-box protein [Pseudomonadota bacterium]
MPALKPAWVVRHLLWLLAGLLLAALFALLLFLMREYQHGQLQDGLQREAARMGLDVRSGLARSVQDLHALQSVAPSPAFWPSAAADLLSAQRQLVHLEWRDPAHTVLVQRLSPFWPTLHAMRPRQDALIDVPQTCALARRLDEAAYSTSYFWPLPQGRGVELVELCLPLKRNGRPDGYLVATYAMAGLLAELIPAEAQRGRRLSWTEADGTRLVMVGELVEPGPALHRASQLVALPGAAWVLLVEQSGGGEHPVVAALPLAVGALALGLLSLLALLLRDLRRRQRAESQLAEALAFRQAMEDSLLTGLRALDLDGRLTYVNPAFCQMVGRSAEQLLGTSIPAPYWPTEQIEEYRQRLQARLAGQSSPREGFESVFMRADGSRLPVRVIEAPLVDAQGRQTGWMSAILDLSEQRRNEELLRASQERLQATARLAMAGEMASLISHELNQPLAAIASYASGSLNLLPAPTRPEPEPDPTHLVRSALQRISEQAERAGKVIKSVADLVRQRDRERVAVPPADLFHAIWPLLQLQARQQHIELELDIEPGCPSVWCQRTMIEQVLLNLARNGMQAMPAGNPAATSGLRRLRLSAGRGRHGRGEGVEFAVADHGLGISQEQAEQLYTPFFTTKPEGMGLGLSLCRTVVEQHGGALQYSAQQPRGTVFRFTLPRAPA